MTSDKGKTYDYDFFVIGGGSGGVRAARIAAAHGARVGLAEARHLGGTCVNVGCVPKKLLNYAADFGQAFEDAKAYGWKPGRLGFEWRKLVSNKDKEIKRLNGIYTTLLENAGVKIHDGFACFVDDHTVEINGQKITADKFLIATGGRPRHAAIPGGSLMITSDEAFHLASLPPKIVIVGGGYIAVEFAHIFHGLGREVTIVHRGDRILRDFEPDLADALAEEMRKQGIRLCLNCDVNEVKRHGKAFSVITTDGQKIHAGLVLAAIGRDANTSGLQLAKAGVQCQKDGKIDVDKNNTTNVGHIYAIGDIANTHNLTPVAIAEGHTLADRLFGNMPDRYVEYDCIPTAIFSQPPIATTGLSEAEARQQGYNVEIFKTSFRPLKHTLTGRDEKTFMKLVVDQQSNRVLGCHMMGADAPEIMQGFAVAIKAGATKADFDRTIGIHPTAAEELVTMRTPWKP